MTGDRGAPRSRASAIDVIIPVHGARRELERCIASVFAHTDLTTDRLVLVDDAGPDFPPEAVLRSDAARHGAALEILRNPRRLGFVGSVNRAMAASHRDVVLLNSDTEVTPRWLEKLAAAAASDATIATVTPFSNHATICSLPRWLEPNLLPAGYTPDSFAAVVEAVSQREYPSLPTGVGVCLYVKREVLDRVGPFDEKHFALGYGEESEFCMRASKAGYRHVLDDATFVFHAGQRSFGASRLARVRRAERRLLALHPEYARTVARFVREDPLRSARERVVEAIRPKRALVWRAPPRRIVHVVHGWPPFNFAGTEIYARGLALRQARTRDVSVYARISDPHRELGEASELLDHDVRVRLLVNDFTARNPLVRNALRSRVLERDFGRFLDDTHPELVHVHHLAGLALGLVNEATRRRIPIVLQLQDWWGLCARSNLVDRRGEPCDGPALGKCAACLPLTLRPPAGFWNPLLYAYRGRLVQRMLAAGAAVVAGSETVVASHRREGLLPSGARVHVLRYGVELPPKAITRATPARPVRFGFIGSIQPHKGLHVAYRAFAGIDPANAVLSVWGDPTIDPSYAAELEHIRPPAATLRGRFPAEDREAVFESIDVLVVPSIGLESFGLVVREALARGVGVLLARVGALAEVSEVTDPLVHFRLGDAVELRGRIERLIAHPEEILRLRASGPIRSVEEHAEEMDEVYAAAVGSLRGEPVVEG